MISKICVVLQKITFKILTAMTLSKMKVFFPDPTFSITQGVLPHQEVGGRGLGPDIKFRGKIWGKVQPSSPMKRKTWEVLSPKVGKE